MSTWYLSRHEFCFFSFCAAPSRQARTLLQIGAISFACTVSCASTHGRIHKSFSNISFVTLPVGNPVVRLNSHSVLPKVPPPHLLPHSSCLAVPFVETGAATFGLGLGFELLPSSPSKRESS